MKRIILILLLLPSVIFAQNSWINIQYLSDNYPSEISWEVLDGYGSVVIESDSNYILNSLLDTTITLPSGNYTLNVNDAYGDGLGASAFGGTDGWYFVRNNCQDTIAFVEGDFGFLYTDTLTIAPCAPPVLGCTNILAINFDSLATIDNGSCLFTQGCTNPNAINYDSTAVIDNYTCIFTYGCTDATALNYDSIAYIDNGTCEYPLSGCTDPVSNNFNPWAVLDDGSCLASTICDPALQQSITMTIRLDNWPSETSWIMLTDNDTIASSPPGTYDYGDIGVTLSYDFCINNTAGFEFILQDEYGDGIAGNGNPGAEGEIVIYDCEGDTITYLSSNTWLDNNGDTVGVNMGGYPNGKYVTTGIHFGTSCAGPVTIDGCTDPLYQEYDPLAINDDGSCTNLHILGCIDPTSFNYDPLATAMDIEPLCNYTLVIEDDGADGWGNSFLGILQGTNTWEFTTGPGNLTDTFYLNLETDKPIKVYYFEIKSGQQSPQQLAFQTLQNSFTLTNADDEVLLQEGTNPFVNNSAGALKPFEGPIWHTYDSIPYCGNYCEPIVIGCMDITAVNYNPDANTPDSCIIPVLGCNQPLAFNYDPLATVDDGSCEAIVTGCMDASAYNYDSLANTASSCIYLGCTDMVACNYDPIANLDNGGCSYPIQYLDCNGYCLSDIDNDGICDENEIPGCTDPLSTNFNPLATDDDSTCIPYVYGCTDSTQFNYNPLANTEDNSCIPVILGCTDPLAFNYDVNANTDDLSCYPVIIGCMDNTMWNYDQTANTSSGNCIPFIYGCTDDSQFNYDPLANTDNGSCVPFIYGCNDATAFNYDPLANTSNNTCCYISGCMDPTALNYDLNACFEPINSCITIITGCTDVSAANYDPFANVSDSLACNYDAGCYQGEGLPYWLNDGCFAWVIDIDDYCCTTDWDASCQSMYDYCQLGWPTGINDLSALGIVIYPNPTKDILTIDTHLEIEVEVIDMQGRVLIKEHNASRLDLSELAPGAYNIIVIHNSNRYNKRVIKQ